MAQFKDYYNILEVSVDADEKTIKTAYIRLAKKWHPDKNPSFDTTSKMQDLVEAYLLLMDTEARSHYDRIYTSFNQTTDTPQPPAHSTVVNDYKYEDVELERWIINAKRQSVGIAQRLVNDLREEFSTGIKGALKGMENFILGRKVF
jgi:curved DNA-binding protein CbpA